MDWQVVAVSASRAFLGFVAFAVQFRMFRTSRSGAIRNVDSLILLVVAFVHSLLWIALLGLPPATTFFSNVAFLLLAFFVTMKLLWSAYAKYLFSIGAFFLVAGKFSGFLLTAVFFLFLGFLVSATVFYLRTLLAGGLAGFLRKHFRGGVDSQCFTIRNLGNSIPHVFVFLAMIGLSRAAHSAFSGYRVFSQISSTDAVLLLSLAWFGVSWGVFALKKKYVTDLRAKILTATFFLIIAGWSVFDWQGESHFFRSLLTACVFYGITWFVRKAFSFYARSDGALFVDYRSVPPGAIVDSKFLSEMLYDYQYDVWRRTDLIKGAERPVTPEWIAKLVSYVGEAHISAVERSLNGFVPRTEILIHRKVTIVPYVALAFLASYASLPETPAHATLGILSELAR